MGLIPIIIALLAFTLLLIMVNISSIQARQQSMGLALFSVCQTAKSRNALLNRLQGVQENLLCPQLPPNHRLLPNMMPEVVDFISAEWRSLDEAEFHLKNRKTGHEPQRYLAALEILNHRQRTNLRTFERKVREYNQLLATYPTVLVALLYRIKPIKLLAATQ
ncbi:MAG: hypothetical protein KY428_00240 [Bacteroidetes bacterium]|nr:hypothetical protein [Bacteroidota bacterium]